MSFCPATATKSGSRLSGTAGCLFTLLFSVFEKPDVFHPDQNPEDSVSNRDFLILISFVFNLCYILIWQEQNHL
jgi:hypothetical protein